MFAYFVVQIVEPYYSRIRNEAYKLLRQCEEGFEHTRDEHDCSVYTGTGGRITLFYINLLLSLNS